MKIGCDSMVYQRGCMLKGVKTLSNFQTGQSSIFMLTYEDVKK